MSNKQGTRSHFKTLIELPEDIKEQIAEKERAEEKEREEKPYTKLVIRLDNKEFTERIKEAITDELSIAQKKWSIELSDEEISNVKSIALLQLQEKVNSVFYPVTAPWTLGREIEAKVTNYLDERGEVRISKDTVNFSRSNMKFKSAYLYRTKKGHFILEKEGNEEFPDTSPRISEEPYENLVKLFETWTRTAVFYGVGSYA